MTKAPTREELERMLKQCDERPQGNVWNWKVADLIRHYLDLMPKGGQQVGPSVGPIARLNQEKRDLKAEVDLLNRLWVEDKKVMKGYEADLERLKKEAFDYRDGFMETSAELENLRELQKAAEAIEGPASWFDPSLLTAVKRLHKAIRKVRGM